MVNIILSTSLDADQVISVPKHALDVCSTGFADLQRMAASETGVDIAAGENACTAFEFAKMLEVLPDHTHTGCLHTTSPTIPFVSIIIANVLDRLGPYALHSRQ